MARPPRQRVVTGKPIAAVYKPAGVPASQLQWINLTLDEFEAIRLIDGQGLDQATVAGQMCVSRPTVTRILRSARYKVAQALTHGQALAIQGGPVVSMAPGAGWRGRQGFGQGRGGPGRHGRRRGRNL